jgi:2'-5' RNA ligase
LVERLWTELATCGFERESRPYRPHIALLRKARGLPGGVLEDPIPWEVREFVLVTSLSVPDGPRYKVLQRWPLAAVDASGLENQ